MVTHGILHQKMQNLGHFYTSQDFECQYIGNVKIYKIEKMQSRAIPPAPPEAKFFKHIPFPCQNRWTYPPKFDTVIRYVQGIKVHVSTHSARGLEGLDYSPKFHAGTIYIINLCNRVLQYILGFLTLPGVTFPHLSILEVLGATFVWGMSSVERAFLVVISPVVLLEQF